MDANDFKRRTRTFALRVIKLTEALPATRTSDVLGRQLLRSGTSVGANYRAACRARSPSDFIAKMKIVEEECDESMYWLELIVESGQMKPKLVENLNAEANEILAMVVASIKKVRPKPAIKA
jgi:four helix bundle protein